MQDPGRGSGASAESVRAEAKERAWSVAAAGTSESSDAPADLLEAFNSKADVPMPERYVRDLRNSRGAAHEKESEDYAIREHVYSAAASQG